MAEAMAAGGLRTRRATVVAALGPRARRKRQASLRALFGAVAWDGDLHAERLDEPEPPAR
jgi:hypothetical protein